MRRDSGVAASVDKSTLERTAHCSIFICEVSGEPSNSVVTGGTIQTRSVGAMESPTTAQVALEISFNINPSAMEELDSTVILVEFTTQKSHQLSIGANPSAQKMSGVHTLEPPVTAQ